MIILLLFYYVRARCPDIQHVWGASTSIETNLNSCNITYNIIILYHNILPIGIYRGIAQIH